MIFFYTITNKVDFGILIIKFWGVDSIETKLFMLLFPFPFVPNVLVDLKRSFTISLSCKEKKIDLSVEEMNE